MNDITVSNPQRDAADNTTVYIPLIMEAEQQQLAAYEQQIEAGIEQMWQALKAIHDNHLYRPDYATFEAYMRARWGYSRRHAYHLLDAANVWNVIEQMCTNGTHLPKPTGERQVRALKGASDDQIITIWQEAVSLANGKVPTGAQVEKIIRRQQSEAHPPDEFANEVMVSTAKKARDRSSNISKRQEHSDMFLTPVEAKTPPIIPQGMVEEVPEQAQQGYTASTTSLEVEMNEPDEMTTISEPCRNGVTVSVMEPDELAEACRNAVIGKVDKMLAARIYEVVRALLEETRMLQQAA
jgi:hypothetical protein